MLAPSIPQFRRRRGQPSPKAKPAPLALVAAVYNSGTWVRLTFDRPVDAAGLVGGEILVSDGAPGVEATLAGTGGVTVIDPATVQVGLATAGPPTSAGVLLAAGAGTGIVAADDGGTWAGVSDVELPFP